jgi:hypothetical protein
MKTSRLELLFVLAAVAVLALAFLRPHHAQAPSLRASAVLTPGVINPDVTQATLGETICRHGWTRTIRPPTTYTDDLKAKQMREYGVRGPPERYQEDHLISLELGGHPTDPRNLWPEPYPRASEVDGIENDLNAKVCSGELTLAEAQRRESVLKHADG